MTPIRKLVTITTYQADRYDGKSSWPGGDALDFLRWFQDHLELIPIEFRESATIELESVGGYSGDHDPRITIAYTRPETDDEIVLREANERVKELAIEEKEKRQLAILKEKYDT